MVLKPWNFILLLFPFLKFLLRRLLSVCLVTKSNYPRYQICISGCYMYINVAYLQMKRKIFQENQTWEKITKIFRKVKRFKIKVIISCYVQIMASFAVYFYCVTNIVKSIFAYFDLFLVIYMGCKCYLQCENYFLCSLHNILIFNTFSKFCMKLQICCFKVNMKIINGLIILQGSTLGSVVICPVWFCAPVAETGSVPGNVPFLLDTCYQGIKTRNLDKKVSWHINLITRIHLPFFFS
jgi:hypothetical protein